MTPGKSRKVGCLPFIGGGGIFERCSPESGIEFWGNLNGDLLALVVGISDALQEGAGLLPGPGRAAKVFSSPTTKLLYNQNK
jgi:hypothetical protein